jgi:hypothetical protein
MSKPHPQKLCLAVEPYLLASMLESALQRPRREVVLLEAGDGNSSGSFDVVVASGRVPSGVDGRTLIRLPAPSGSATTGVVRRSGGVEIVQIPTLASLVDLVDHTFADET